MYVWNGKSPSLSEEHLGRAPLSMRYIVIDIYGIVYYSYYQTNSKYHGKIMLVLLLNLKLWRSAPMPF
jgi:hypothetical protein